MSAFFLITFLFVVQIYKIKIRHYLKYITISNYSGPKFTSSIIIRLYVSMWTWRLLLSLKTKFDSTLC